MRLTWYGHAAFLVETGGQRVILDPFRSPDSGGYEPIDEPADLVVVSHENDRYHSHLGQIRPPFEVLRALEIGPEGAEWRGIRFVATRVFETPERLPEDEVTVVHIEADGLRVVFLGDLGHPLSAEERAPLEGADLVLAAAGGPPTIALAELRELLDQLAPRVVVPMHYLTPKINLKIEPVERLLEVCDGWPIERPGRSTLEIEPGPKAGPTRLVVLEHAR